MTLYHDLALGTRVTSGTSTDESTAVTASITIPFLQTILIFVAHGRDAAVPSDATSITGASISSSTFLKSVTFGTVAVPRFKLEVWVAVGTGSAGAVQIDFAGENQNGFRWWLAGLTEADENRGTFGILNGTTPGSGWGDAGTTYSLNNRSITAADAGTRVIAATAHSSSTSFNPKSGWTENADAGNTTPPMAMEVQYKFNSQDTAPTATPGAGTPDWAMLAVEIAVTVSPETRPDAENASGDGQARGNLPIEESFGVATKPQISPHVPLAAAGDNFRAYGNDAAAVFLHRTMVNALAPNAEAATITGAAQGVTTLIAAAADAAVGVGAVTAASPSVSFPAGSGAGTGAAQTPQVKISVPASAVSGAGEARGPASTPSPSVAAGAGQAYFDNTTASISEELDEGVEIAAYASAWDATVDIDESQEGTITQTGSLVLVAI